MKKKKTEAEQVVGDLGKVIGVCEKHEDFSVGPDITLKKITDVHGKLDKCNEDIKKAEAELTELRDLRDDLTKAGKALVSRARKGAIAFFGPDSTQYAQTGGKRLSEHRPRTRKSKDGSLKAA